jgi:hypothetical protein
VHEEDKDRTEDFDEILGSVDIDAIVATAKSKPSISRTHETPKKTRPEAKNVLHAPSRLVSNVYDKSAIQAVIQNSTIPSTNVDAYSRQQIHQQYFTATPPSSSNNSSLDESIRQIRKMLREVREACDDASLNGFIPPDLEHTRGRLEAELSTKIAALHTQNFSSPSVPSPEVIQLAIQEIRAKLRKVREECDDAYLMGEVPVELEKQRAELEQSLANQSKLYREARNTSSTPSPSVSMPQSAITQPKSIGGNQTIPVQCNCGQITSTKHVLHGSNSGRLYNCCSSCGFHSWAGEGHSCSSVRISNTFQSNPDFKDSTTYTNSLQSSSISDISNPQTTTYTPSSTHALSMSYSTNVAQAAPIGPEMQQKMIRAKHLLRNVFGHSSYRPGQERIVQV